MNRLIGLIIILIISNSCSISKRFYDNEHDVKFTRFVSDCLGESSIHEFISTKCLGDHAPPNIFHKRYESMNVTFYFGEVMDEFCIDDYYMNVISETRHGELWSLLSSFGGWDCYDIDEGRIFHEVVVGDYFISYYLKSGEVNLEIENCFQSFLKDNFDYNTPPKEFPYRIYGGSSSD